LSTFRAAFSQDIGWKAKKGLEVVKAEKAVDARFFDDKLSVYSIPDLGRFDLILFSLCDSIPSSVVRAFALAVGRPWTTALRSARSSNGMSSTSASTLGDSRSRCSAAIKSAKRTIVVGA